MKKLYLIGGTMGVGKTTTCQILKRKLDRSVFIDGDWCWDMHPFMVNEETKKLVLENICMLLNNDLKCSVFEHILFCWVMHEQSIINAILENIDKKDCNTKVISLVCSPDTLRKHLEKDIENGLRTEDVIERSIQRLPLYDKLNTTKIHIDTMSIDDITKNIVLHILNS